MHPDAYITISKEATGDFRDRGSKFPTYAFPCSSEDEIKTHIQALKKLHPQARHFCYGAVIGSTKQIEKSSDDGEPSGTAGLPILNQILSSGITNILIVVVRYFGGTKLGKPGLIHAYKQASIDALSHCTTKTKYNTTLVQFTFEYDLTGQVMNRIDQIEHATIDQQLFTDKCSINVNVPNSAIDIALHSFDHTNDVHVEIV